MTSCLCLCRVSLRSPLISTSAHCSYKLTQREEWGQEVGSKGWGKGLNVDVIPTVRVWISVSFCLHWCSLPFAALAALVPRHARLVVLLVWATSWFNCWWCCWLEVQKKIFFCLYFTQYQNRKPCMYCIFYMYFSFVNLMNIPCLWMTGIHAFAENSESPVLLLLQKPDRRKCWKKQRIKKTHLTWQVSHLDVMIWWGQAPVSPHSSLSFLSSLFSPPDLQSPAVMTHTF